MNTVEGAGILYSGDSGPRLRAIRALAETGLRTVRSRVSRYWFVNDHDRGVFVARGLADADRSVVAVATGVRTQQFDPAAVPASQVASLQEELRLPSSPPLVTLVAGRLLRSKGIQEFIDMARRLRRAGVEGSVLLVGPEEPDNPDAFPVARVEEAVAEGALRWVRFREDVWTVYAASDVVVVPTAYAEGTPKGVMEGMAMARPVVCSAVPSIRAMVRNGEDAVLVPPRDTDALARAVAALLRDPARREAMGGRPGGRRASGSTRSAWPRTASSGSTDRCRDGPRSPGAAS